MSDSNSRNMEATVDVTSGVLEEVEVEKEEEPPRGASLPPRGILHLLPVRNFEVKGLITLKVTSCAWITGAARRGAARREPSRTYN